MKIFLHYANISTLPLNSQNNNQTTNISFNNKFNQTNLNSQLPFYPNYTNNLLNIQDTQISAPNSLSEADNNYFYNQPNNLQIRKDHNNLRIWSGNTSNNDNQYQINANNQITDSKPSHPNFSDNNNYFSHQNNASQIENDQRQPYRTPNNGNQHIPQNSKKI